MYSGTSKKAQQERDQLYLDALPKSAHAPLKPYHDNPKMKGKTSSILCGTCYTEFIRSTPQEAAQALSAHYLNAHS